MSGMGYRGKTTNLQRETVAVQSAMEVETKMGEMPGEIVAFNSMNQTATIQPLYTPVVNGEPLPMPELLEVPVRFPRAGNGGMTFPIQAGDKVTLRPQMRSSESYHEGGDYTGGGARYSSLSDMEAYLDGGESLSDPMENFDADNAHIRFSSDGAFGIKGSADGKFSIDGAEGNIFALLADVVEKLGEETELENKADYAAIATKLRSMQL